MYIEDGRIEKVEARRGSDYFTQAVLCRTEYDERLEEREM